MLYSFPCFFRANHPQNWPQKGTYDKNTRWGGPVPAASSSFPHLHGRRFVSEGHIGGALQLETTQLGGGGHGLNLLSPFVVTDLLVPAILVSQIIQMFHGFFHKSSRCFVDFHINKALLLWSPCHKKWVWTNWELGFWFAGTVSSSTHLHNNGRCILICHPHDWHSATAGSRGLSWDHYRYDQCGGSKLVTLNFSHSSYMKIK